MGSLAGSLLQPHHPHMMGPGSQYGIHDTTSTRTGYSGHHGQQHMMVRGGIGPNGPGNTQQQYAGTPYGSLPQQMPMMPRQNMQHPPQTQYPSFDPYGYSMNPQQMQNMDPRMGAIHPYSGLPQFPSDAAQYARRASEPAPIPSYPRGPPRKPKQSGHALWVGNLPPNATVTDLKDHFSRDATKDIESLFLISKSNCAFVNYRTEAACISAMNRFHDSRFGGVRLVCRLRRGSSASSASTTPIIDTPGPSSATSSSTLPSTPTVVEDISSPTIVGGSAEDVENRAQSEASPQPTTPGERVPERFFIVKSLTVQDLEASVRNGTWATQSHNEKTLNEAYESADNVFLIFSANKSGEYFGYARMASLIQGEPVNLSSSISQPESSSAGTPQSIPTPATATAPRGRIIDDSARGTIFWEAERSDKEDEESPARSDVEKGNQNWGRQFSIEWVSTTRLPFYRTRGLRNPWK